MDMALQQKRSLRVDRAIWSVSQLVGRQRELGLIWNQYEAAKDGNSSVALLIGEQGIGKTRLLDEFTTRATEDGALVLRGGASEANGKPPYLPFLEAIGKYIRTASQDRLCEQIAHAPYTLLSIFPELAAHLGDTVAACPLPLEQAQLRLYEAIGFFLENMSASQVLALVLDDLQWADSASLGLLCHITKHHSKAKLLILGAYRESEIDLNPALGRTLIRLNQYSILHTVAIDPLTSKEVEELAVNYLKSPIRMDIGLLLHTQSGGNPFFAEELLRGWVETKALIKDEMQWVATTSLESTLPSSITGALRRRLALLSAETVNHLRVAAIIGRTFDLTLLALVEGQEIEDIEEQLIEAEHAQLVRSEQAETFTFNHDKIRACIYTEVSASRRRLLHETIGNILEAQYEAQSTKSAYLLATIAFHFMNSGNTTRAVTYTLRSAEEALRLLAAEEAEIHYHRALQLLARDDKRYGIILLGLSEVALLIGTEQEAIASCEEALTWFAESGRADSLGLANCEIAHGDAGSSESTIRVLKSTLILFEEQRMVNAVNYVRAWLNSLLSHPSNDICNLVRGKLAHSPDAKPQSLPANLTMSEARVLQLVVRGKRNRQIAQELGISEKTVANHLSHIFSKTTSENRAAAAAFAIHHGLA
jgi:predicted ATPase/DNA-binding CsgD family transcriptional regulator